MFMYHDNFCVLFKLFFFLVWKKISTFSAVNFTVTFYFVVVFFHTFCSFHPVPLLLSILLCNSKVDGIMILFVSHILQLVSKWQFQDLRVPCLAVYLPPGEVRVLQRLLVLHRVCLGGLSWRYRVWKRQYGLSRGCSLYSRAAPSNGRETWAGREPGNLWKCFSTFALDILVVVKWSISALMASYFQVCIHLKGWILYKNSFGGWLQWGSSFTSAISQHSNAACPECMRTKWKELTQAGAGCWPGALLSLALFPKERKFYLSSWVKFWLFSLIYTGFKEGGRTSVTNWHLAGVWFWTGL